jgi:hypothetical protein
VPDAQLPIVDATKKRQAAFGDYIVLFYDARNHRTEWFDYTPKKDAPKPVLRNASLFPIVYFKEKMAVHVCGLHFGDTLTVTMSPTGLPEGGADFRGATPNVAPALQSTVDALSGSGTTGGSVQAGGVIFGSTAPIGSLAVSGITLGSNPAKTSKDAPDGYNDATITIPPEQLVFAKRAYRKDAVGIPVVISELMVGGPRIAADEALPGSITYLQKESRQLLEDVRRDSNGPNKNNPAIFDEYEARIQAFIGELAGLDNSISSAGLGARVLALQQNYATIVGIENMVSSILAADAELCKGITKPLTTGDMPSCHYWEERSFKQFQDEYERISNAELGDTKDIRPQEIFSELQELTKQLRVLVTQSGQIFKIMNSWYEGSSFEQADLLTPATGNALERINIILQRTYSPFTFAASPGPGGGTAPATGGGSSPAGATGGGAAGASGGGPGAGGSAPGAGAGGGGGQGTGGGQGSGGGQGAGGGGPASSTTTPAHTVETVLVEVHRRANFNIVAGAMVIRVPTKSFSLVPQIATSTTSGGTTVYPASCNGGRAINIPVSGTPPSAPYYCATVTQTSDWQVAGMAGVAWFPLGRDYFPRGTAGSLHLHNMVPALLAATSVTSLGNSFLGPDFEPVNGLDLYVGIATAHQTGLPSSQSLTTVLLPVGSNNSAPALSTVTHVKAGLTLGIGFDFSVFTQIFSKTSSAGLP